MRVALLLPSHYRNGNQCFLNLKKHLLDLYDVDLFLHMWDTYGYTFNGVPAPPQAYKKYGFDRLSPKIDINNIVNLYQPIKIVIEDYSKFEHQIKKVADLYKDKCGVHDNCETIVSLQRKVYLCNRLKQEYEQRNNFTYDVVIRGRFDLLLNEDIKFGDLNIIHTPKYLSYETISDVFAYSSSKNMDYYSSCYLNFQNIYNTGIEFNPHNILLKHLQMSPIPFVKEDIKMELKK
jgi:hypothetical protein